MVHLEFNDILDYVEANKQEYLEQELSKGDDNMENQVHLNAVGEITEMIYFATHPEEKE
jgi:hypothetical protein